MAHALDLTTYKWSKDTARCESLINAVNWQNVQAYASSLHENEPCTAEAPIGIGGRHFVRILTFEGGERWLARFLMPKYDEDGQNGENDLDGEDDLDNEKDSDHESGEGDSGDEKDQNEESHAGRAKGSDDESDTNGENDSDDEVHPHDETDSASESELAMLREADCLRLVAERTTIPVPKIFAVVSRNPEYGPAFMLIECLPGNVGMDVNFDFIPEQFKASFFKQMANAHVRTPYHQVLTGIKLTHFVPGTNVQHHVPSYWNTSQTLGWDHECWPISRYRRSI